MTGLLYTHFHDNINFLNNPSYLKSEKPVCCINFLQQLTLYRLSLTKSLGFIKASGCYFKKENPENFHFS